MAQADLAPAMLKVAGRHDQFACTASEAFPRGVNNFSKALSANGHNDTVFNPKIVRQ
jgi:hypothetical protein